MSLDVLNEWRVKIFSILLLSSSHRVDSRIRERDRFCLLSDRMS